MQQSRDKNRVYEGVGHGWLRDTYFSLLQLAAYAASALASTSLEVVRCIGSLEVVRCIVIAAVTAATGHCIRGPEGLFVPTSTAAVHTQMCI
jgi:hypothetical protein